MILEDDISPSESDNLIEMWNIFEGSEGEFSKWNIFNEYYI